MSSTSFHHRPNSPTRIHMRLSPAPVSSVRFSPSRSIAVSPASSQKQTCLCSPTTHPGSFRCSLHKDYSIVRNGSVEGDLVKRTLAILIRPSSHQQRRRGEFKTKPSRLSIMSKADDQVYIYSLSK
ncbi:uncharacterized protein LOC124935473 [Impatiens glandulifera]|uniref:uncharacterized protein LOC124935473 n=1 Tax=Impatiens glandulifera TaxID=253017 RepID=UPI001FB10F77|nr:uncharacterized protein LOC124935473 [Impatiens glandulifera]